MREDLLLLRTWLPQSVRVRSAQVSPTRLNSSNSRRGAEQLGERSHVGHFEGRLGTRRRGCPPSWPSAATGDPHRVQTDPPGRYVGVKETLSHKEQSLGGESDPFAS